MGLSSPKSKVAAVVLLAGVLPALSGLAAHFLFGTTPRVQEPLHESQIDRHLKTRPAGGGVQP